MAETRDDTPLTSEEHKALGVILREKETVARSGSYHDFERAAARQQAAALRHLLALHGRLQGSVGPTTGDDSEGGTLPDDEDSRGAASAPTTDDSPEAPTAEREALERLVRAVEEGPYIDGCPLEDWLEPRGVVAQARAALARERGGRADQ